MGDGERALSRKNGVRSAARGAGVDYIGNDLSCKPTWKQRGCTWGEAFIAFSSSSLYISARWYPRLVGILESSVLEMVGTPHQSASREEKLRRRNALQRSSRASYYVVVLLTYRTGPFFADE